MPFSFDKDLFARINANNPTTKISQRYEDITDYSSPYYQQFRGLLGKIMPTQGTNYIAGLQAGGGNLGASQVQAQASQQGFERRRSDFLNTGVSQFALGSQEQASGLLGMLLQDKQFQQQLAEMRRQFDEGGGDFWDSLLNIGGMAAGFALAPMTGGASLALPLAQQAGGQGGYGGLTPNIRPSDRRSKENIEKVGVSPSGINIYEFNYIGGSTRFRGGMTDENPNATIIINGEEYLDYSKIDVSLEVI